MSLDTARSAHLDMLSAPPPDVPPELLRSQLMERFNQAVRRPARFGGTRVLPLLLDQLTSAEGEAEDIVWIPDTNARLSPAAFFREFFPTPEIHVVASQYGEDAFRRGWLRLDRTLADSEFSQLVDGVLAWSKIDRTVHDVIERYGPASITFGDPDARRPKSLGYASRDRDAPFVVFHLDSADDPHRDVPAAVLLAVRVGEDFFNGWRFTPRGERQ